MVLIQGIIVEVLLLNLLTIDKGDQSSMLAFDQIALPASRNKGKNIYDRHHHNQKLAEMRKRGLFSIILHDTLVRAINQTSPSSYVSQPLGHAGRVPVLHLCLLAQCSLNHQAFRNAFEHGASIKGHTTVIRLDSYSEGMSREGTCEK